MKMSTLTEKTNISLYLAVAVIGGGAWWLSALYSDVQFVKRDVSEMKADMKSLLSQSKEVAGPQRVPSCKPCQYSMLERGK
jgi:hypothetical protein